MALDGLEWCSASEAAGAWPIEGGGGGGGGTVLEEDGPEEAMFLLWGVNFWRFQVFPHTGQSSLKPWRKRTRVPVLPQAQLQPVVGCRSVVESRRERQRGQPRRYRLEKAQAKGEEGRGQGRGGGGNKRI